MIKTKKVKRIKDKVTFPKSLLSVNYLDLNFNGKVFKAYVVDYGIKHSGDKLREVSITYGIV